MNLVCVLSGERVNGKHQPHHALQPGARLQQVLREEGEGEAQQLSTRVTRWVLQSQMWSDNCLVTIL